MNRAVRTGVPERVTSTTSTTPRAMLTSTRRPALVVAVGALAVVAAGHHRSQASQNVVSSLRPAGIPASVSTPLATLMGLSPVKGHEAPRFSLTDQNGRPVSLSEMRGKVVVLEFMDPHCTDICPIVSKEFVDASHDLGALN